MLKQCRDCNVEKPLDQFWRNRSSADGRALYCIPCFTRRNQEAAERRAARQGRTLPPPSARPRDLAPDEKYCPSCRQVLPLARFVRNKSTASGYGSYCRPCQAEKAAESLKRVHGSSREYHLRRRYGVGTNEVLSRLESQGSSCLVCRRPITADTAHVDHDHVTGKVRGILCFRCNSGMGHFADDPDTLVRAARYLLTAAGERLPFEVVWTERLAEVVEYVGTAS